MAALEANPTTPQADPEKPLPPHQVGERLRIRISEVAFGGEGVGRYDGYVVFVKFTAPGEKVEVELREVHRNYGRADLLRVLESVPERVTPPCRHFGACGGCQYQHLDYAAQLSIKHQQVSSLIERIGKFPAATVDPILPCPAPHGYRNRIMVRSQWNKLDQRLVLGFLRHDSRLVVDVEECLIAEPELNRQLEAARRSPPPRGGLKVALRVMPDGWQVPRDSFFQNNFHLLPTFVDVIGARLRDSGCRFLVDAYCGVGFFALELAERLEAFVGIELDLQAVHAARHNATERNCANGEFLSGSVEELLPSVMCRWPNDQTALLLDPPRRGCARDSLLFLRDQQPEQILYISCHPATLARDLRLLCETGVYRLERVVPLDMFPQTQHVELVADLRRVRAPITTPQ